MLVKFNPLAIRNNASTARGCELRREEVLLIKRLGDQRWKKIKDAGRTGLNIEVWRHATRFN